MEYIFQIKNVNKKFSGVYALKDITLDIEKGETIALVGENGAGKSTLMKVLTGAYRKDSGTLMMHGKEVDINNTVMAGKCGIVQVYQQIELCPELTVAENILLGESAFAHRGFVNRNKNIETVNRLLQKYGIPLEAKTPVKNLSAAMKQLAAIAKVLYKDSQIIIWDEPTAVLSEKEVSLLMHIIEELKKEHKTMIYISHRLEEVFRLCDRIAVMRDGALIKVLKNENLNQDMLIEYMLGRSIDNMYIEKKGTPQEEAVLELENVTTDKIKDISFQLKKSEILGLAGLVSSGRTEIARAVYGLDKIQSGSIRIHGRQVRIRKTRDAKRLGIFFAPEDRKKEALVLCRSIRENISLSHLKRITKAGICNAETESELVVRLCSELDVKTNSVENKVQNLSGGNQQKVVVAKAIAAEPEIVIFDEPTQGIDVGAKAEIYAILEKLRESGLSIIVISSEMEELQKISDRIIVMHEGRQSGELTRDEVSDKELLLKLMYRST